MISFGMLRDVWAFRDFMLGSVKREFQSRYTGSQLGPLWVVAQPLALIVIYTVIFSKIMHPSLPGHDSPFAYSIYLCSGILTWMFFAEMLGRSVNIFIEQAGLLKKVSFPKLCLPIIVVASSSLSFVIVLALFLIFLLLIGHFPGWVILSMIPVLILQAALATGLGILLSTINVFYRDINQTVSVVLQFWFWLTPIVYPASIIPERVQAILEFNPVWPLIRAYHTIFLDRTVPDWTGLAYPFILSVVFVWLGIFAFFKLQGEIVDEL